MTDDARAFLGDIADVDVGFPFRSDAFTTGPAGYRLLRGDNIAPGATRWDNAAFWSLDEGVPDRYELRRGDVVLAMDRPWISGGLKFAAIRTADLPGLLVQRVARLRAKAGNDQGYIRCVISSRDFTDYVLAVQTGTSIPHISGSQIESYQLSPHPLREQRAIAEVAGTLDDKIAANSSLMDISGQLAVALLSRTPPTTRLGEIVVHHRSSRSPDKFGSDRVAHYSLPAFDEATRPEEALAANIKSSKFDVAQPSVLVSKLNPRFPRVWDVATLPEQPAVASTEFLVLESKYSSSSVLWAVLSQPSFSSALESKVAGTSGSHQRVRPDDLLATLVVDPRDLSEVMKDRITSMGSLIASKRTESAKLKSLRDALLPGLMSGRIRVKDAEDRVGEVL